MCSSLAKADLCFAYREAMLLSEMRLDCLIELVLKETY